jgi:uncharacterized protein (TIGR01777 family)
MAAPRDNRRARDRCRTRRAALRIAVTGASGFIGTAIVHDLIAAGHSVLRLVRREPAGRDEAHWDPQRGRIDAAALAGVDAAVHWAGESIAGARWTPARKARIRDSRVLGTRLLANTLAALSPRPHTLVCASGAGWYGDRGDVLLREDAAPGVGFLADTCRAWEAAADPARDAGMRVTALRLGLVLDPSGGVLPRLLPIFRFGLGAPLGTGNQWWSWITLEDLRHVVGLALERDLAGAVNVAAPRAVTNLEFTRSLCRSLGRGMLPAVPRFALRLLFGEMADAALLASARLEPARLLAAGYTFQKPELDSALAALLGETRSAGGSP